MANKTLIDFYLINWLFVFINPIRKFAQNKNATNRFLQFFFKKKKIKSSYNKVIFEKFSIFTSH